LFLSKIKYIQISLSTFLKKIGFFFGRKNAPKIIFLNHFASFTHVGTIRRLSCNNSSEELTKVTNSEPLRGEESMQFSHAQDAVMKLSNISKASVTV